MKEKPAFSRYFSPLGDSVYSFPVAANVHLRRDYWDSIWQQTMLLRPGAPVYEYSDANMILVQQALDSLNEESIDLYLKRELYERLGMQNTVFNPRSVFTF